MPRPPPWWPFSLPRRSSSWKMSPPLGMWRQSGGFLGSWGWSRAMWVPGRCISPRGPLSGARRPTIWCGRCGARLAFETVTVTGTENLMMAATLAKGTTVLENAASEPEVVDLARLLQAMGARIEGAGTSTITIGGGGALTGARPRVVPDRIEAGTLAVAAAITLGDVLILGCVPHHVEAVTAKLREAGASVTVEAGGIRGRVAARPPGGGIRPAPLPRLATDMQAQITALRAIADGRSVITETVFENRFMHIPELVRMGADITVGGREAVVQGVPFLRGAPVMATDLRASASLVLAGLQARGETVVDQIYHLDRGYERLEAKLQSRGGEIRRGEG